MTRSTPARSDERAVGPDAPPARQRWWHRLRGLLWREPVLVGLGSLLVAVVLTWPTMANPTTTVPQDLFDPLLIAWELAWPGYALLHQPGALWQANVLYPEADTFAFTDSLLGYAPLSLVGTGPEAAVFRYNVAFVLAAALASAGGYALARRLGAAWPGAVVAGLAFGYAPWRLGQAGHLHVLSTGGIALALAALAKGHGYSFTRGYRPEEVRPGWAAAGWALACWQLTIGFGIGLPFGYVLGLVCLAAGVGWLVTGRPPLRRALLVADGVGMVAFVAVVGLMARPYLRVVEDHPYARRSEGDLALFSPPPRGFLVAPETSWLWGETSAEARAELPFPPEMTMLPGVFVAALALVGLFLSVWSLRQRVWLGLGVAVSLLLAAGTTVAGGEIGYLLLYRTLPGWDAIRTPGRLVVWTTLLLALLAAGLVTAAGDRWGTRVRAARPAPAGANEAPGADEKSETDETTGGDGRTGGAVGGGGRAGRRWPALVTAAALVPAVLVGAEGLNTTPHPTVPVEPASFRGIEGPALVLPSDPRDQWVMLWSTDGFPKIVNGGSGFTPRSQERIRLIGMLFPSPESVAEFRALGIRTVLVLREGPASAVGTPYERALTVDEADLADLPLRRVDRGDGVVYELLP